MGFTDLFKYSPYWQTCGRTSTWSWEFTSWVCWVSISFVRMYDMRYQNDRDNQEIHRQSGESDGPASATRWEGGGSVTVGGATGSGRAPLRLKLRCMTIDALYVRECFTATTASLGLQVAARGLGRWLLVRRSMPHQRLPVRNILSCRWFLTKSMDFSGWAGFLSLQPAQMKPTGESSKPWIFQIWYLWCWWTFVQ